jgi:hypothetical protein
MIDMVILAEPEGSQPEYSLAVWVGFKGAGQ